jgi:mono/diheme cytochrome c family protein
MPSEEVPIMREALVVLLLLAGSVPIVRADEPALNRPLTETEQRGQALFNRHCASCHPRTPVPGAVAPAVSRESQGGQAELMGDIIRKGTPRMPGFANRLGDPEIDAIVQYLKTVPAPEHT